MKNDSLLIIIDPQNDFVDRKGSLYVPGSEKAIKNICKFIQTRGGYIEDILISQDTHQKFSIGFPVFWNSNLHPFDKISIKDILNDKIKPVYIRPTWIDQFKKQFKKYRHEELTVWPDHCIEGSWGWCFPDELIQTLNDWNIIHHRNYKTYKKGYIPELEAYSLMTDFKIGSNIEISIKTPPPIFGYSKVYICGFCKDICVAETLYDLKENDYFKDKLVILDNCMATLDSNSSNLKIYEDLIKTYGAKIENV